MPLVCDYCHMPDPNKCLAGLNCRAWWYADKKPEEPQKVKEEQPESKSDV